MRERLEQLLPTRRSRVIAGAMAAVAVVAIAVMVLVAALRGGDTTREGVAAGKTEATSEPTADDSSPAGPVEEGQPEPHLDGPVDDVQQDEVPAVAAAPDTSSKVSAADRAKALRGRDSVGEQAPGTVNDKVRSEEGTQAPIYPTGATTEAVADTTDTTKDDFAFALGVVSGKTVTAAKDQCLLDWATATLPTKNNVGELSVQSVCGTSAAVLVGGYGVNGRDLTGRAAEQPAFADVKGLLFGPTAVRYASVATTDNKAVLFVVAPA